MKRIVECIYSVITQQETQVAFGIYGMNQWLMQKLPVKNMALLQLIGKLSQILCPIVNRIGLHQCA